MKIDIRTKRRGSKIEQDFVKTDDRNVSSIMSQRILDTAETEVKTMLVRMGWKPPTEKHKQRIHQLEEALADAIDFIECGDTLNRDDESARLREVLG